MSDHAMPLDAASPSSAGGLGDARALTRREVLVVFTGVVMAMLLGAIDQTIVNTALPTIVGEFRGLEQLPWLTTVYMLASTLTMPLYGKLSDIYGRRRLFLVSITVFLAGSVLCGASQSMTQLIVFRGLQGIGGGGLMTMGIAVIGEIVSPRERGRYMGYLMPAFFVATVVGPLLGGFLVDQLSWRWIFYINIPLGLAALVVTMRGLAMLHFEPRKARIDFAGVTLLMACTSCLLLVATWGGRQYAWDSEVILGLAALGVLLFAAFLVQEGRAEEPIIPLRLFRTSAVRIMPAASALMSAALFGAMVFLPIYLQSAQGYSPTESGLRLTPMVAGMMASSTVTGRLITRTGRYKIFVLIGLGTAPLGLLALSSVDVTSAISFSVCLAALGAAMGMVMPVIVLSVQNAVHPKDLGVATSSVNFLQSMGGTFGLAMFGALFNGRLASELATRLPASGLDLDTLATSPEAVRALPGPVGAAVTQAMESAVHTVFIVAVPIVALAFLIATRLEELPLREVAHASAVRAGGPGPVADGPALSGPTVP